jgi:hypothetical protein
VRHFETIEELRLALLEFRQTYTITLRIPLILISHSSRS